MKKQFFEAMENGYVSPELGVTMFFEQDVITTSTSVGNVVGDEEFDVNGSAVDFD